jgi:hypothetical protein
MDKDSFAGWDVRAMSAAVVAGVRFHLGDEVIFVVAGDRFLAAFAGAAEVISVSFV